MKKFLFSVLALMLVFCVGAFAQVDSTAVSNVTTSGITLLFDNFGKLISNNVWTVVFFVCFILSEILAAVKFTPKNSVGQVLWYALKAIVKFFASKKS